MKLIACIDTNFAIGYKGNLLYKISEDLQRFKALTYGKTVVMGSKTYDSIGHPLKGRLNIVITHNKSKYPEDVPGEFMTMTMGEFIYDYLNTRTADAGNRIYVIGGGEIYNALINFCDTLELTIVHPSKTIYEADTFINNLKFSYPDSNRQIDYNNGGHNMHFVATTICCDNYSEENDIKYDYVTYRLVSDSVVTNKG